MQADAVYERSKEPIPPDPAKPRRRRFLIGVVILLLLIVGAVFAAYESARTGKVISIPSGLP